MTDTPASTGGRDAPAPERLIADTVRHRPEVECWWYSDRFGFHQHPDSWSHTDRACRRVWIEVDPYEGQDFDYGMPDPGPMEAR